jgi:hypothetical protein
MIRIGTGLKRIAKIIRPASKSLDLIIWTGLLMNLSAASSCSSKESYYFFFEVLTKGFS